MKFLFDLFPVILFFGIFKWSEANLESAQAVASQYLSGIVAGGTVSTLQAPILLATAVAILASFGQIGWLLAKRRKVDPMLWLSLAIIVFFGGATIYFNNETFIKWKPTVLYWCFAAALVVSRIFFRKNLIRTVMEKQISLPDMVWDRLNLSWIGFFIAMGILNLYVAYSFSTNAWVNFKMFGGMGLMFAFVIAQSVFLSKHMKDAQ